jgi:hypothetical protein
VRYKFDLKEIDFNVILTKTKKIERLDQLKNSERVTSINVISINAINGMNDSFIRRLLFLMIERFTRALEYPHYLSCV